MKRKDIYLNTNQSKNV